MSEKSFWGRGWQFPPSFNNDNGQVAMAEGEREIEDSLRILLGTTQGERFMAPGYGLNLESQLFESLNTTAKTLLTDKIKRTLLVYEPRINLLSIKLDDSALNEGKLLVLLDYEIRASNSRFNLVYPYYLHDGSEVSPTV
ncbi:GPW/gp25 family protein [Corallincola platygyrae]|uniref:GPW/gp25 family protein n=1 Tax=Corallincola platygyrae TaxID=1193278 RepID=A0ABW4XRF6_9GAMM